MRRKSHFKNCKEFPSYHYAVKLGLQLKELAKQQGFNPKCIKILSKEEVLEHGTGPADAQLIFVDMPDDWLTEVHLLQDSEISVIIDNKIISVFNV